MVQHPINTCARPVEQIALARSRSTGRCLLRGELQRPTSFRHMSATMAALRFGRSDLQLLEILAGASPHRKRYASVGCLAGGFNRTCTWLQLGLLLSFRSTACSARHRNLRPEGPRPAEACSYERISTAAFSNERGSMQHEYADVQRSTVLAVALRPSNGVSALRGTSRGWSAQYVPSRWCDMQLFAHSMCETKPCLVAGLQSDDSCISHTRCAKVPR